MSEGLAVRLRPTKLSQVIGQEAAVETLKGLAKNGFPHFMLFTGPSGCGKTTLARIVTDRLGCHANDFDEVNAAKERGIDLVRGIEERWGYSGMGGDVRVWLIDEAHALTSDAQGAFLKMLEDTKLHVYFIFCTTNPEKLKPTIRTRATTIDLKAVSAKHVGQLLEYAIEQEGYETTEDVIEKIVDVAGGSPRKALVLLEQVAGVEGEAKQMSALVAADPSRDAIEIARALMKPGTTWNQMAKILSSVEGIDDKSEGIRWLVLSYMSTIALKGGKGAGRAVFIIDRFRDNFFDCKKAGLIAACYECLEK